MTERAGRSMPICWINNLQEQARKDSGQLCTVITIDPVMLEVGVIVQCKVAGNEYLPIVKGRWDDMRHFFEPKSRYAIFRDERD